MKNFKVLFILMTTILLFAQCSEDKELVELNEEINHTAKTNERSCELKMKVAKELSLRLEDEML